MGIYLFFCVVVNLTAILNSMQLTKGGCFSIFLFLLLLAMGIVHSGWFRFMGNVIFFVNIFQEEKSKRKRHFSVSSGTVRKNIPLRYANTSNKYLKSKIFTDSDFKKLKNFQYYKSQSSGIFFVRLLRYVIRFPGTHICFCRWRIQPSFLYQHVNYLVQLFVVGNNISFHRQRYCMFK